MDSGLDEFMRHFQGNPRKNAEGYIEFEFENGIKGQCWKLEEHKGLGAIVFETIRTLPFHEAIQLNEEKKNDIKKCYDEHERGSIGEAYILFTDELLIIFRSTVFCEIENYKDFIHDITAEHLKVHEEGFNLWKSNQKKKT